MTRTIGIVVLVCMGIVLIGAAAFGLELLGLEWTKFFAPRKEDIRRGVFEKTWSYNKGMEQDLVRYRLQWLQAENEEERKAIESTIRHAYAGYDDKHLEKELRTFLKEILYGGFYEEEQR
jgi:hypothetical protein